MATKFETAETVLRGGGFFRTALERDWRGLEKFKTRLRTAEGFIVKGVGPAVLRKFEAEGKLARRETAPSSTYPIEFGWKEGA